MIQPTVFLARLLAGGPVPAVKGEAAARAVGISPRTLDRARHRLGVVARRQGGRWWWSLPSKDATAAVAPAPKGAMPLAPVPAPPPDRRRVADLRPGDLVRWNGRDWPLLTMAMRDRVPVVYFRCNEAAGGIACHPVWAVSVP